MREIQTILIPYGNPLAKECQPSAVDMFRRDLRQYEKDHPPTRLERDKEGDYRALSMRLADLDKFLYEDNRYSRTILYPIVMPAAWGLSRTRKGPESPLDAMIGRYDRDLGSVREALESAGPAMHPQQRAVLRERESLLAGMLADLRGLRKRERRENGCRS